MDMETKRFESLYPDTTRKAEISKVLEYVSAGKSCQVIGAPGVGKSNCLRLLPYNKGVRELHLGKDEPRYHFVYMDLSEVAKKPLSDILKFILISLAASFGERKLKEQEAAVNKFLSEALKFSDEMVFSQNLKKSIDYLTNECELNVVFLMDRFEEYVPNIDSQFFLNLKILRNRAKYRFAVVFGVVRPIEDVLETQVFAEFYEFLGGNVVYLPVYDPDGTEFRIKHLEGLTQKKVDLSLRKRLIELTAGHGKLARICYEALLATDGEQPTINSLGKFLLSKKQVGRALSEIWNFLTPEERKGLRNKTKNGFLDQIGLTKDGKLTIPLFDSYLTTLTLNEAEELKLIYDPARNEILKGDQNLTELLSPQEFRLLRYLLQNPGRVCEKDEIISNVWKNSKTQEGVTDQALDQIIYRLRKKIEEDPNNPKFIQTIKGRGYKTP